MFASIAGLPPEGRATIPMKLLHILQSANPVGGGVIEAVNQFTAAHQRQGHTVEIVSLDAPDSSFLLKCPVPVRALGRNRPGYGYAHGFSAWLRQVRCSFDAIIVNGIWQYAGFAAHAALSGTETPYVVFPHGMLDPWFKRKYPLKHLKKTLYWWLAEYRVLRDARLVLFTCEEEQRLARQSFRPYRCREAVANLGTTASSGNPVRQRAAFHASFPGLEGKRLFLFLGRLHEKKGCDLLIRAFAKVYSGFNADGEKPHLIIAGPCADSSYLATLTALAATSFPSEVPPITWTGMLDGEVKWGAYRAAEAFILPSHQENFGFSVVEALSCELPVLISDKVNIWREIHEDRAGFVETDDFDGTYRLLQGWLSMEPKLQRAMRTTALGCFMSRFEITHAAGRLIELLNGSGNRTGEHCATLEPMTAGTIAARGSE